MANFTTSAFVYLIIGGKAVKIGIADNPKHRLSNLQTAHYERLRLYCSFQCRDKKRAAELERLLHSRYARNRIKGEWFRINPDQVIDDVYSDATLRTFVISHEIHRVNVSEIIADFVSKKKEYIYDSMPSQHGINSFIAMGIALVFVLLISLGGLISASIPMYILALMLAVAFGLVISLMITLAKAIYDTLTE